MEQVCSNCYPTCIWKAAERNDQKQTALSRPKMKSSPKRSFDQILRKVPSNSHVTKILWGLSHSPGQGVTKENFVHEALDMLCNAYFTGDRHQSRTEAEKELDASRMPVCGIYWRNIRWNNVAWRRKQKCTGFEAIATWFVSFRSSCADARRRAARWCCVLWRLGSRLHMHKQGVGSCVGSQHCIGPPA